MQGHWVSRLGTDMLTALAVVRTPFAGNIMVPTFLSIHSVLFLQEGGIRVIISMVTLEAVTLIEEESFPLKKLTLQIIPQLEMTLQLQFPPLLALQFQTLTL